MKRPNSVLEVLENRIAPATFHWITNGEGNWNNPANWYNETTNTEGDGFPNSSFDTVEFGDFLEASSTIRIPNGVTITVQSLSFDGDFDYRIVEEGTGKLQLATGGIIYVVGTNTGQHEIAAPLVLLGNSIIRNDSAARLIISDAISSPESIGGLEKTGSGVLQLAGTVANTYTGTTKVLGGTLELAKSPGVTAVPGLLMIGDLSSTAGATVRLLNNDQIATVTVDMYQKAEFDLDGHDESIGSLTMRSGDLTSSQVHTDLGTLTVQALSLVKGVLLEKVGTGAVGAVFDGNLRFGSAVDMNIADGDAAIDLLITGNLSSNSFLPLSKNGLGRIHLEGNATLSGGLNVYKGEFTVDGKITGRVTVSDIGTFGGAGTLGELNVGGGMLKPGMNAPGTLSMESFSAFGGTLVFDLNGLTPGEDYDQINVAGTVNLGKLLAINVGYTPQDGDVFTIIKNGGTDPVLGSFIFYPEGSVIKSGDHFFQISYTGGDGNDVTLTALVPDVTISPNGKIATFTDVDGDLVTIKTTRGKFDKADFSFVPTGNAFEGQQLTLLNLGDDGGEFANADISITAKRGLGGGNGFVNVGYINATGVDLRNVTISGDLGRIEAGDGNKVAITSLTVGSIGQLEKSTTGAVGIDSASIIDGSLTKLVVKGDVHSKLVTIGNSGSIGSVTIGGSLNGGMIYAYQNLGAITVRGSLIGGATETSGTILAGNIGAVKIGGSVIGGTAELSGSIHAEVGVIRSVFIGGSVSTTKPASLEIPVPTGDGSIIATTSLGPVVIRGDVTGSAANPVIISGSGNARGVVRGVDLAIQSVSVAGRFELANVLAGYDWDGDAKNADASIGPISVGGDWVGSSVLAGVGAGEDGFIGTSDDASLSGDSIRDNDRAISQIASIVIKGQVYGVSGYSSGIVAEQIKSARIGGIRLPLGLLAHNPDDFFPLAATGSIPSGLPWNFAVLEVLAQQG